MAKESLATEKNSFHASTILTNAASKRQELAKCHVRFDFFQLYDYHESIVKLFNDFICFNQGELAQFNFLAGEFHKPLKDELRKEVINTEVLRNHFENLTEKISKLTAEAFNSNCQTIEQYFIDRSKNPPRFCVKANKDGRVFDIFRPNPEYFSLTYSYKDNTGCESVVDTGKYYICNNVPKAIQNEEYNNPRIDCIKVRRRIRDDGTFENENDWYDCWQSNSSSETNEIKRPHKSSCYKSTLIIPITLLRNKLDDSFRSHFRIPKLNNQMEISRAIYGFFCIDHVEPNYFNEDLDVKAGYIFADIMSLYIITGLMFTEYSGSYNRVKEMIGYKEENTDV